MKKLLIIVLFILLGQNAVLYAQHAEGDLNLNIGIGLIPTYTVGDAQIPPIGISGEYGITDQISVGGFVGFASSRQEVPFITSTFTPITLIYKYNYITVGARGSYHFAQSEKFDPYVGVFLGYNIVSSSVEGNGSSASLGDGVSGLGYAFHLGARYKFNEKVGAFAEVGYGLSVLQIGLNLKLK